jgi:hypothetical protein
MGVPCLQKLRGDVREYEAQFQTRIEVLLNSVSSLREV